MSYWGHYQTNSQKRRPELDKQPLPSFMYWSIEMTSVSDEVRGSTKAGETVELIAIGDKPKIKIVPEMKFWSKIVSNRSS